MTNRRLRFLALLPLLFALAISAKQRATRPFGGVPQSELPPDVFSYAQPAGLQPRHLSLDLTVDFDAKVLRGTATYALPDVASATQLVLDTKSLTIDSVMLDGHTSAIYTLAAPTGIGAKLTIDIPPGTRSLSIAYRTSPAAEALHWMAPAQTAGHVAPYLYSQNESLMARTWIPCPDTPSVRMPYDATIRVPPGLLALMSAANPTETNASGVYTFFQREPVPAYLIALAVGRLGFRPIGTRTGVYGEPELLDDAALELQWLPQMLDAGEKIAGPYRWERYDVLLMPPGYVVGGMEHPRLNFVSPFPMISGNHPAAPEPSGLIAHEMSHSWAGDLVTLATWNDVWLNEGITSYLTTRVLEELAGPEYAEYAHFSDRKGYSDILPQLSDPKESRLHQSYTSANFISFASTPYTKGSLFMETVEETAGRQAFDAYLRDYFATYSMHWVDDRAFLAYLRGRLVKGDADLEERLQLDDWVYGTGLPSNVTAPTTSVLWNQIVAEAAAFNAGKKAKDLPLASWRAFMVEQFLVQAKLTNRMAELDAAFHFSDRNMPPNNWMYFAIDNNYTPANPAIERALARGGPNSTIMQIYFRLSKSAAGTTYAKAQYAKWRERYDPSVQAYVDKVLKVSATVIEFIPRGDAGSMKRTASAPAFGHTRAGRPVADVRCVTGIPRLRAG